MAGLLAIVVVGLVAWIAFLPLGGPGQTAPPTSSPASGPSATVGPTPGGTAVPSTPSPLPSFIRPTPTPLPTFTAYTVQPGDSLTSIAHAFNTTPRSLAWWNRGTYPNLDPESPDYSPNHIEPGWVLAVLPGVIVDDAHPPTPSPGPPTPTPGPATPSPNPPTSSPTVPG